MTRTAASNVQVLTAGTRQDQTRTDGKAKGQERANASTVVTLMVSPEDAERIALAQSEGEIMLMLRNPLDTEPTVTAGVKTASLLGGEKPSTPAPALAQAHRGARAARAGRRGRALPKSLRSQARLKPSGLKRTEEVIR